MCLISDTPIPSIAEEDIICYKCFGACYIGPGYTMLTTPYIKAPVCFKQLPYLFIARGDKRVVYRPSIFRPSDRIYEISKGFIHAYRNANFNAGSINYKIYVCKIPKGSKYYVSRNEICADRLIILRDYETS